MSVRCVVFFLDKDLPIEARFLLEDFRLAANNAVRKGLQMRVTSRNALNRLVYKDFRREHPKMYSQHLVSAYGRGGSFTRSSSTRLSGEGSQSSR